LTALGLREIAAFALSPRLRGETERGVPFSSPEEFCLTPGVEYLLDCLLP